MEESYIETADTLTSAIYELETILVPELIRRVYEKPRSNEPSGGGKPKSSPPLDVNALDLADKCNYALTAYSNCRTPARESDVFACYRETRLFLGFDAPMVELTKVCGACGNKLMVARDASTDVYCTNPECAVVYRQEDWVRFLYVEEADCT